MEILDQKLYNESVYYKFPTSANLPYTEYLRYTLDLRDPIRVSVNEKLLYYIPGIKEHKDYETVIEKWDPNILSIILNRLENKTDILKYKDLIIKWYRSKLHALLKLIRWVKLEDILGLENIIINWNLENIKILVKKWMTLEQIKQCEPIIVWLSTKYLEKIKHKDIDFLIEFSKS